MPSLSEHGEYFSTMGSYGQDEFMVELCKAIESLTESRVVASHNIERLELRIEELEAQLAQLTPPKDIGPVVKPAWQKISESDLPAEGM